MATIKISVIIPTRNRSEYLIKALESIIPQSYPADSYEILIIDNGSSDNTREIAEQFCQHHGNVRYFLESNPGLHNARHRGALEAYGSILAYIDDDVMVSKMWMEGISESFTDDTAGLVTGNIMPYYEANPPEWMNLYWQRCPYGKVLGWLTLLDFGETAKYIDAEYVYGANFAIRKDLLIECKGFHPDSMPPELLRYRGDGETGLVKKIKMQGYKAIFDPNVSIFHLVSKDRMSSHYLYERAFSQGISYSYSQIRIRGNRFFIIPAFCKRIFMIYYALFRDMKHWHFKKMMLWLYYIKGFFYHQINVLIDKELRNWVLQDSYVSFSKDNYR